MGRPEYRIKKSFEVRPYKFKELCSIYNVSPKTLRKWLYHYGIKLSLSTDGGYYKIPQVENIIDKIGMPYVIYEIDLLQKESEAILETAFEVRPYKLKELCELYKVDPKTFRKWMRPFKEEIGESLGDYFLIPQVEIIIQKISIPYNIVENKEKEFK